MNKKLRGVLFITWVIVSAYWLYATLNCEFSQQMMLSSIVSLYVSVLLICDYTSDKK